MDPIEKKPVHHVLPGSPVLSFGTTGCNLGAVHDILQSPGALQNIMSSLRPGAWVAAGGGKWAPWAMMALNLQVRTLHAPYVRSFSGFGRPWNHLAELIEDIHVREVALGSGYIVTGQAPRSRRRG